MLHDFLGLALISMGALTMVARVMARAAELQRRPARGTLRWAVDGTSGEVTHPVRQHRS
jgi:hypothetical protein